MWRGVFQAHILLIGGLLYTDPVSAVAGRLLDSEDAPVSGVTVAISEIGQAQVSGPGGKFAFGGLPAGEYTLQLTLGKLPLGERSAEVEAGGTTRIEIRLEDALGYAETLTVQSPSRRVERVIDAPAAVSAASEKAISQQAAHGQAPKVLEFQPGVEVTQTGRVLPHARPLRELPLQRALADRAQRLQPARRATLAGVRW